MAYGTRPTTGNVNGTGLKMLDKLGNDPRVESIDDERFGGNNDGLWIYTVDGFCNGDIGCHIVHEYTVREVIRAARSICPCDCTDCVEALALAAKK